MMVAPASRASSTSRRLFSSMPVSSITPLTASWRVPPSVVKSFWYSIRIRAVLFGSTSIAHLVRSGIWALNRTPCTGENSCVFSRLKPAYARADLLPRGPPPRIRNAPPCAQRSVDRPMAGRLRRSRRAEALEPDDRRGHRRDRRPHDPDRRPVARGLRVVQLPGLPPRHRDHRRGAGVPAPLGHPPQLVAAPGKPGALRADRGAADRAPGL